MVVLEGGSTAGQTTQSQTTVVEIYGGGSAGGAAAYLRLLLPGLKEHGLVPLYATMGRDNLSEALATGGIQVARVATVADLGALLPPGPVILHSHGVRANHLALQAARRYKLPVVATVHSYIRQDYTSLWRRLPAELLDHFTLRHMTAIIAISRAVAGDAKRRAGPRVPLEVIYNGTVEPKVSLARSELCALFGLDPHLPVVLTPARLHPVKGHLTLLGALQELRSEGLDCQLLWLGEGPWRSRLEREVASRGLGRLVFLPGQVHGAAGLMTACDVVAIPSRMEGLGLAAIEALAARVPLLASRVGGLVEVVEDGQSGLLLPPDDVGAWAAALRAVLRQKELRSRLVQGGQARYAALFSPETFVTRTAALLTRAAAGGYSKGYLEPSSRELSRKSR